MKIFINIIIIGISILSIHSVYSQESIFEPFKLKIDYFNNKNAKNGISFSDKKGNAFKIKNSNSSKGLFIKQGKKWIKHGNWYNLYNGRITRKTEYNFGKIHGTREIYHKNGKVQFEDQYVKNIKQGVSFQYREDGTKVYECPYVNGYKDGVKIEYLRNGKILFKKHFKKGKLNGEVIQYNSKGEIVAKTQYKQGKKIGKTIWK